MNTATTHRHEPAPASPATLLRRALRRIGGTALLLLVMALAHELAAPAAQEQAPASASAVLAPNPGPAAGRS
jgi:hypothetical protein